MRAPTTLSEPGMPAMRAMELRQVIRQWQEAVTSIANCRVPVIAAVHGLCLGGGVDVTSACDMRFASAESEMSIKEANVGIVADMGSLSRVGRIVGEGIMREWAYTGRNIKAGEAERRGYYNAVLPTPQECLNHALQVATEIGSASSPIAVQGDVLALILAVGITSHGWRLGSRLRLLILVAVTRAYFGGRRAAACVGVRHSFRRQPTAGAAEFTIHVGHGMQ
jgi:enoyl-CoA hydratase/carnithine racemase